MYRRTSIRTDKFECRTFCLHFFFSFPPTPPPFAELTEVLFVILENRVDVGLNNHVSCNYVFNEVMLCGDKVAGHEAYTPAATERVPSE